MLRPLCAHRASPAQRVQSLVVVRDTWFTPMTSVVKMERLPDPLWLFLRGGPLLVADLAVDIMLRVLEVELVAITTASEWERCAGDAGWSIRRPCMVPDAYVTPGSIRNTQRPVKCPECRAAKKSTRSGDNVFLIKKQLYIVDFWMKISYWKIT